MVARKLIPLVLIISILVVSIVSAGLLDDAKKVQDAKKQEKITGNYYKVAPKIAQKTSMTAPTTKSQPVPDFGTLNPGDKLNIASTEIILQETIKYQVFKEAGKTKLQIGSIIIIVPNSDLKISRMGTLPPTGAPIKNLKKQTPGRRGSLPPTGAATTELTNTQFSLKDRFFSTKGSLPPTGAPVADLKSRQKKFKVENPKSKSVIKRMNRRGSLPPVGAAVKGGSNKKPKFVEKLKELFRAD